MAYSDNPNEWNTAMTTMIISEPFWRGTRHNVICTEHGKVGATGIEYDAEQMLIAHETEHIEEFANKM